MLMERKKKIHFPVSDRFNLFVFGCKTRSGAFGMWCLHWRRIPSSVHNYNFHTIFTSRFTVRLLLVQNHDACDTADEKRHERSDCRRFVILLHIWKWIKSDFWGENVFPHFDERRWKRLFLFSTCRIISLHWGTNWWWNLQLSWTRTLKTVMNESSCMKTQWGAEAGSDWGHGPVRLQTLCFRVKETFCCERLTLFTEDETLSTLWRSN